ncbi:hypothetical protein C0991_005276 [Blastosporella zonata]|nr:hypothetical protein C0991_005276 [Blastosporella zonata]
MTKRKATPNDFVEEDEDVKPSKRTQKNKAQKEESDSDYPIKKEEEDEDEDEDDLKPDEPLAKKAKKTQTKQAKKTDVSSDEITVKTTPEGDKYIELGKKKRATVRCFKGIQLIDIREYYGNEDEEKPSKKGISLTVEQWETLKKSADVLDELFANVHAKKK